MCSGDESDDDLLVRAGHGDDDAFAGLYRRHRDWVLRIAWRLTADREDALDVLQEAFTSPSVAGDGAGPRSTSTTWRRSFRPRRAPRVHRVSCWRP